MSFNFNWVIEWYSRVRKFAKTTVIYFFFKLRVTFSPSTNENCSLSRSYPIRIRSGPWPYLKAEKLRVVTVAMRIALSLVVVSIALVLFVTAEDYDDVDSPSDLLENVDSLLRNRKFMEAQIRCVRTRRNCDRVGTRIADIVNELQKKRRCLSCNRKEKAQMKKVIDYVEINYNDFWRELNISNEVVRNLD